MNINNLALRISKSILGDDDVPLIYPTTANYITISNSFEDIVNYLKKLDGAQLALDDLVTGNGALLEFFCTSEHVQHKSQKFRDGFGSVLTALSVELRNILDNEDLSSISRNRYEEVIQNIHLIVKSLREGVPIKIVDADDEQGSFNNLEP